MQLFVSQLVLYALLDLLSLSQSELSINRKLCGMLLHCYYPIPTYIHVCIRVCINKIIAGQQYCTLYSFLTILITHYTIIHANEKCTHFVVHV